MVLWELKNSTGNQWVNDFRRGKFEAWLGDGSVAGICKPGDVGELGRELGGGWPEGRGFVLT